MTMHLLVVVLTQMVQLVNGGEEVVTGLANLTHYRLDPLDKAVEGASQLTNLIVTLHLEPLGQIPVSIGNIVQCQHGICQRLGDSISHDHSRRQCNTEDQQDHQHTALQRRVHIALALCPQGGQIVVDIIDIETGTDDPLILVQHHVEGQLGGIATDRGFGRPVLGEAIPLTGHLDDVLDQQLALGILVVPAVFPFQLGTHRKQYSVPLKVIDKEVAIAAVTQWPEQLFDLLPILR